MTAFRHAVYSIGLLGGLLIGVSGCAQLGWSLASEESISKQQDERAEQVAREFAEHNRQVRFESARQSVREGNTERAIAQLQQLLNDQPQHLEARLLLAELLLDEGRANNAVHVLEPALATDPENARLHYLLGIASDALGQSQYAVPHYELAYRLEPDNPLYAASYEVAIKALGSGAPSADFPQPNCGVAQCAAPPGGEVVPAAWIPQASDLLPGDRSLTQDAVGYLPDRTDRALPPANLPAGDAVAGNTDAEAWLERGNQALAAGDREAAAGYLARAVAADPQNPATAIAAAVAALQYNESLLAAQLLESALSAFPNSPAVFRALGTAYYRLGEYARAQRALQQALSLDNRDGLSYFLMGCTLAKMGQIEAAATFFRQAGALDTMLATGG